LACGWWLDGPRRARRLGRRGRAGQVPVEPTGSAQVEKDSFFLLFLFSEIISSAKIITVKSSKCLQGTKNDQKITKIPGKFLEID
jgi:hypothetical protein